MCKAESGGRLTPIEERVRQYLIERAKKTDPGRPFQAKVIYGDLCKAIDPEEHYWAWPRFRGIGKVLGRISTFEREQGRPMLSALVVQAGSMQAGTGFAGLGRDLGFQIQPGQERAFWRAELDEVVRYWTSHTLDESAPTPTQQALALLATISEELTRSTTAARRGLGSNGRLGGRGRLGPQGGQHVNEATAARDSHRCPWAAERRPAVSRRARTEIRKPRQALSMAPAVTVLSVTVITMSRSYLLVIGDAAPLAWVLTEQRMAFPALRRSQAAALEISDELFIYATRGCFHNPSRDRGRVMGLALVSSVVRDLAEPVVFDERRYTSGCTLDIQGIAPCVMVSNFAR